MNRRGWIETSLAALFSLILSISGPLLFFFMLPLQVLAVRCGKKAFTFSVMGVFFGSIFLKLILQPDMSGAGSLIITDLVMFLFFLSGLYVVNFQLENFRTVLKFLIVTLAAGLCSIPVLYSLNADQSFYTIMTELIDSVLVVLNGASPESSIFSSLSADDMYNLFKFYFLNSFLAVYFFLLTITWWLGRRIGFKSMGQPSMAPKIVEFDVPEKLVWFFFVPLTVVLLNVLLENKGMKLELGMVGFAVSNSLYIMGALYALHGLGLAQYLLEKRKANLGMRRLSGLFLIIMVLIFPLNIILVFLLTGLGVSELWINYRHKDKELIQ